MVAGGIPPREDRQRWLSPDVRETQRAFDRQITTGIACPLRPTPVRLPSTGLTT